MLEDYEKKVVDSPVKKVQEKKWSIPEGWSLIEKRGRWCVRNPNGDLAKFGSLEDAETFVKENS